MMLKIQGMENCLDFDSDNIFVLQILNKSMFYNTAQNIYNICNGQQLGVDIIFSKDNAIFDVSKFAIYIGDILSSDGIIKNISTKLAVYINENSVLCDKYTDVIKNIQNITADIYGIVDDLDSDIVFKKDLTFTDIIKNLAPDIELPKCNILERLQKLIDIVSMLKVCGMIIIPHLKEYLCSSDLLKLYNYSFHKKIKLLLLESKENADLPLEKIWKIEDDLSDNIIIL